MRNLVVLALGAVILQGSARAADEPPVKQPPPQPIAKVLGKPIFLEELRIVESDKTALRDYFAIAGEVLSPLVAKYIKDQKLEATDEEIKELEDFLAANDPIAPSPKKAKQKPRAAVAPDHTVARGFVEHWKFHKALHDKYGGRVIFQQAGIEPLDAYVKWLADEEQAGNFQILNPKWKEAFGEYYTPKYHRFLDGNEKDLFKAPFWRAAKDAEEKPDAEK